MPMETSHSLNTYSSVHIKAMHVIFGNFCSLHAKLHIHEWYLKFNTYLIKMACKIEEICNYLTMENICSLTNLLSCFFHPCKC